MLWTRRRFLQGMTSSVALAGMSANPLESQAMQSYRLNYILCSALYGDTPLETVIAEVRRTGTDFLSLWPAHHGTQRLEADQLGERKFSDLLFNYNIRLGAINCYDLGPFDIKEEIRFARRVGGPGVTIITRADWPVQATGTELLRAIRAFHDQLQPQVRFAEKLECKIAIINHPKTLIDTPDSMQWFADLIKSDNLGLAYAPQFLEQDERMQVGLLSQVGKKVKHFFAREYGQGAREKMSKELELQQLPGRGRFNFQGLLAVLKAQNYQGFTEICMQPVPRGVPILDSPYKITAEINLSRSYLDRYL